MSMTRVNSPQEANLDQAMTILTLERELSEARLYAAGLDSLLHSVKQLLEDGELDEALELLQ